METVELAEQNLWGVIFRIRSCVLSLPQLSNLSGLSPENGSFTKGEKIPKWLQPLEKREFYDSSRLQIGVSFPDRNSTVEYLSTLAVLLKNSIPKARKSSVEFTCEIVIQSFDGKVPFYFFLTESLIKEFALIGAGLRFQVG